MRESLHSRIIINLLREVRARIYRLFALASSSWRTVVCFICYPLFFVVTWLAKRLTNFQKRIKPHLLILRNGYYSKGNQEPSTEKFHLDETLFDSGLATFTVKIYESFLLQPISDFQFLWTCIKTSPDAIVMSSWSDKGNQPSNKLLKLVRKQLGIRVVVLWWDTCSRDFANYHLQHFSCADINVVMDNPSLEHLGATIEHPQQVISMWTPQTPRMFQKIDTKDIDLAFLGQISNYRSNRAEYIDHLNASLTELKLYISTSDRTYQPSHAEYASILSRSKMSVNFSYSVDCHQLKGRVFDVMLAGGLLFESENAQITRLFCPMEDYVPFTSKEDLVEKIKYFHRNQEQLNKIAQNARAKVLAMYGPKIFWSKVLGESGCI